MPSVTSPDAGLLKYACGFAWNFSTQRAQQKKYFFPPCSHECLAVAGFTLIPQTGSRSRGGVGLAAVIVYIGFSAARPGGKSPGHSEFIIPKDGQQ